MNYASNEWKIYLIDLFISFYAAQAINVLYYQLFGLTFTQIAIMGVVLSIAIVALEIPTGIFADRYGRRKSLIVGASCITLAMVLLTIGTYYPIFLIAMVFAGCGIAFRSGAISALLYDSLREINRQEKYRQAEQNREVIKLISLAIAVLVGSYAFTLHPRLPYLLTLITGVCSILSAIVLIEPPIKKTTTTLHKHFLSAWEHLAKKQSLLTITLFFASVVAVYHMGDLFYQPYLKAVAIPISLFGMFYAILAGIASIVNWKIHKLEQVLGIKKSVILVVVLMLSAYVLLSQEPLLIGLLPLIILHSIYIYVHPFTREYINQRIPSEQRATVLSITSMFLSIIYLIFTPLIGHLADTKGIPYAFSTIGILFVFLLILTWYVPKLFIRQSNKVAHD